jgi:hypothetical protein
MEETMDERNMDRKEFLSRIGRSGACLCAAAAGMASALAGVVPTEKRFEDKAARPAIDETPPGEPSPERAARRMEFGDGWIRRFLEVMERNLDEATRERLMRANGEACYAAYAGKDPPWADPVSFERFADWIARSGKEQGYSVAGRDIFTEFTVNAETGKPSPEGVCLCPMVEAQAAGKIPAFYCLCAAGYVREMHERLLGRPVQVQLVDSVLRGGKRCKFKINLA